VDFLNVKALFSFFVVTSYLIAGRYGLNATDHVINFIQSKRENHLHLSFLVKEEVTEDKDDEDEEIDPMDP